MSTPLLGGPRRSVSSPGEQRCCSVGSGSGALSPSSNGVRINPQARKIICAVDSNKNETVPSEDDIQLLAKLHEANRQIECDQKSLNSMSLASGHSRRSSDTSQVSLTSGSSGSNGLSGETDPSDEDIWNLWNNIASDYDTWAKKKNAQLKELVRKGVPHHFRAIIWQLLAGSRDSPLKNKYAQYIKRSSPCEKVIRRDIARTYPEHDFFKEKDGFGQESLFNVMKAYSLHDREVGYCQGSAFIVGLLLMQQMPEEEAFATFVRLMQEYRLREMFKPTMSELGLCMFQLETLVQELIPELHQHFQAQSFYTSMYASSWFLTLFTTSVSVSVASRIMDVFLLEGIEIVFRVAVAVLTTGRDKLLQQDMEGMLRYFQREMPEEFAADPDALFHVAFNIKYNAKKMKKLEKDYTVMKTKEQEDQVELRRLRMENRLLRQKSMMLERESAELADRLLQDQVNRANLQEDTFEINRELSMIRERDSITQLKLLQAEERIRKLSYMMEESISPQPGDDTEPNLSLRSQLVQQKEELIRLLQEELVKTRLKGAEDEATIKDLKEKVAELEEELRHYRDPHPELSASKLDEELLASRQQELDRKSENENLRLKLDELAKEFEEYRHKMAESMKPGSGHASTLGLPNGEAGGGEQACVQGPASLPVQPVTPSVQTSSTPVKKLANALFGDRSGPDKASQETINRLEGELLQLKFKEAQASAAAESLKQQLIELETQAQVNANYVRRAEEDVQACLEREESWSVREKEAEEQRRAQERRYADLESQMKEELMLGRIREAENSQKIAELTQKISSLEFRNQEMLVEEEIIRRPAESDSIKELQDKVSELKAEIVRLQLQNRKLSLSFSCYSLRSTSEASDDEDLHLRPPPDSPPPPPSSSSPSQATPSNSAPHTPTTASTKDVPLL